MRANNGCSDTTSTCILTKHPSVVTCCSRVVSLGATAASIGWVTNSGTSTGTVTDKLDEALYDDEGTCKAKLGASVIVVEALLCTIV